MEESCTTNQETKECRPTQIKTGENNKQKEITPKNKKFRSVITQLYEEPRSVKIQTYGLVESRSVEKAML